MASITAFQADGTSSNLVSRSRVYMKYTIYKTTNLINGKFYIGKHQTINLNDGYLGSGKALIKAIQKYGRDNFQKEVLFEFNTEAEMNAKEIELVTEEFCKCNTNYNLGVGGEGGSHFKGRTHSEDTKKILSEKAKLQKHSEESRLKISEANRKRWADGDNKLKQSIKFTGRKFSEEHKRKISEAMKGNKNRRVVSE